MLPSKTGVILDSPLSLKSSFLNFGETAFIDLIICALQNFKECRRIFEQENFSMFWKRGKTCSERNANDRVKFNNAF